MAKVPVGHFRNWAVVCGYYHALLRDRNAADRLLNGPPSLRETRATDFTNQHELPNFREFGGRQTGGPGLT